jgi:hypothetical protein
LNYLTYDPHPDLSTIVKCYWTLEVPKQRDTHKQLVLPDGCVDICFILGDDIKRYVSEDEFIIQPREMLLGQITEQFYIQPTGYVNTFAIRFYPYGLSSFIDLSLDKLSNKETPLDQLFGVERANRLSDGIINAESVTDKIARAERFLFDELKSERTIDKIVKSTIDAMLLSGGGKPLNAILKDDLPKRRQLERNFKKQIGLSPKQLSKVIRLQATLQLMLGETTESLTAVAYENAYYDQAHFIKDFKEFTGVTPKDFLTDEKMVLSSLLYKKA